MRCELLESTKRLAKSKGLPVNEIRCSMGSTCDGLDCIYQPNGHLRFEVLTQYTKYQTLHFRRVAVNG